MPINDKDSEELLKLDVHKEITNVPIPPPLQAPIEGIKINKGLQCVLCPYIGLQQSTMNTHWNRTHAHDARSKAIDPLCRSYDVEAQTLFIQCHRHFFSVDSRLEGLVSSDPYMLLIQQYGHETNSTLSMTRPTGDRDFPILVKKLGWNKYLQEYCVNAEKRALLIGMATLPSKKDDPLHQLSQVVKAYLEQIREEEHLVNRQTLRSLMCYPM
jgi:hypothetical protein